MPWKEEEGRSVVRQKYPDGEQETGLDTTLPDNLRQAGVLGFGENPPPRQQEIKNQRSDPTRRRRRDLPAIIGALKPAE